jgi:hypothetical protein
VFTTFEATREGAMKHKSSLIGAFAVAVVLALPATSSAKESSVYGWCPEAAGTDCGNPEKRPVLVPERIGPKIKPTQVRSPYGGDGWRSGSWMMS